MRSRARTDFTRASDICRRTGVLFTLMGMMAQEGTAAAKPRRPPPPLDETHLRGLEILLRPTIGAPPPDSPVRFVPAGNVPLANAPGALLTGASPWPLTFGGQVAVGWRQWPLLSAGIRGGYRTTPGSNLPDGSTHLTRTGWDAGFYVRVFPLARSASIAPYFDPWISLGFGYQHDRQSFKRTLTLDDRANVIGDVAITHHAMSIPLSVGLDYRFAPFVAVGPSFEIAVNTPVAGCVSTSAPGSSAVTYCSNKEPGRTFIHAATYFAWNAGLDVKLTF